MVCRYSARTLKTFDVRLSVLVVAGCKLMLIILCFLQWSGNAINCRTNIKQLTIVTACAQYAAVAISNHDNRQDDDDSEDILYLRSLAMIRPHSMSERYSRSLQNAIRHLLADSAYEAEVGRLFKLCSIRILVNKIDITTMKFIQHPVEIVVFSISMVVGACLFTIMFGIAVSVITQLCSQVK